MKTYVLLAHHELSQQGSAVVLETEKQEFCELGASAGAKVADSLPARPQGEVCEGKPYVFFQQFHWGMLA